jgi:hypothetical protein
MEDGESFKEERVRVSVTVSEKLRVRFRVTSGVAELVGRAWDLWACLDAHLAS